MTPGLPGGIYVLPRPEISLHLEDLFQDEAVTHRNIFSRKTVNELRIVTTAGD